MGEFSQSQKRYLNELLTKLNVSINSRVEELEKNLNERFEELKSDTNEKIRILEGKVAELEHDNSLLRSEVSQIRRRQIKKNLVIHGLSSK